MREYPSLGPGGRVAVVLFFELGRGSYFKDWERALGLGQGGDGILHVLGTDPRALGSSLLFLSQRLQQQPHWRPLETNALDLVLNLVLEVAQAQ